MVYLFILVLLLFGAANFDGRVDAKAKGKKYYWFCYLVIVLVFGLRYRVGGDTLNYMLKYSATSPLSDLSISDILSMQVEPAFAMLMAFFKQFTDKFYGVQLVESAFVNFVWFKLIYERTNRKFLGAILFFLMDAFYFNTEIMREAIAVGIFVIAYKRLERGELLKYYGILMVGILFHYSCLFLILVPFFRKYAINLKRTCLIIASVLFTLAVSQSIFHLFGGYLADKISNNSGYYFSLYGIIASALKYVLFPYWIMLLYQRCTGAKDDNPKVRFIFVQMIYGSMALGEYAMLMRLSNYMQPFFLVILVDVLECISFSKYKSNLVAVCIYGIIAFSYIMPYMRDESNIVKGARFYCLWFPYHSILDETKDPVRETFVQEQFDMLNDKYRN